MVVLGSTGSIGVNVLNIAKRFDLQIEALIAGNNVELLNRQIELFNPKYVGVADKSLADLVCHKNVFYGNEGIVEVINLSASDLVVNALVGFLGLKPTMEAIKCGKRVALANKESLVAAGKFVDVSKIVPIDSEHFALWYLQNGREIEKMTITASGGPFRNTPLDRLKDVKPKDALKHPNWSMGDKISIDSATMTNKLFEILEAKWLFKTEKVDALIENKSVIHALIDFKDGSTTAHFARADMKLPIAYALLGDKFGERILPNIDILKIAELSFEKIDEQRYPIWSFKDEILNDSDKGVVINAANEVGVERFLSNEIGFLDIFDIVKSAFYKFKDIKVDLFEDVFEIDKEVRKYSKRVK
ncbi:MAG: 1-deoxy-D-xylulose-5-phosphate reductoisomerase [Epsilonproteobacteria bacterium]|nr:1-deoxy-D-xylulose-5-phosphate reductoisomerase [Campylobacterota bacterium]